MDGKASGRSPSRECQLTGRVASHDTLAVYGYEDGEFSRRSLALASDQRPAQELVRLAQWLSGRHLEGKPSKPKLKTHCPSKLFDELLICIRPGTT